MLRIDLNKCTGCKRCEAACAFFHTGRINNFLSRIHVLNLYETGIDGPVVCVQCLERYCLKCPVDAMTLGEYGQIVVSPTICTLCGACEKNCPIGAIVQIEEIVYVCDLCGGAPKCVEACTEGALQWQPQEAPDAAGAHGSRVSLKAVQAATRDMNPSQKQYYYLSQLGLEVRKQWGKVDA